MDDTTHSAQFSLPRNGAPARPVQVVVMGVSGTGKSAVAGELARRLGAAFVEGDDLHPQANKDKMAAGTPLTDEDRWPWLERIAARMREEAAAGRGLVVTCSALRRAYRDVLRGSGADVVFAHLSGPREVIAARLGFRRGHFFPAALLDSQLATLEPLGPDEPGFAVDLTESVEDEVRDVMERIAARERPAED